MGCDDWNVHIYRNDGYFFSYNHSLTNSTYHPETVDITDDG